jgi:hypothetical protein
MGTRPDTPVRALRRRHDALLTIWLAFLDELDNPSAPERRGAPVRATATPRHHPLAPPLPNKDRQLQLLVHSAKRPQVLGTVSGTNAADQGVRRRG